MIVSMSIIASVMPLPALKLDIDRHQIIAAVDLHAVAGVVDHRHLRPRGIAQEIADRRLHRRAVEVDAFGHHEADVAQALCHRARIVGRIGQRPDMRIGAVADHQRNAPAGLLRCRALALLRQARAGRRSPASSAALPAAGSGRGCRSRRGRRVPPTAATGEPLRWPGWPCCRRRRPCLRAPRHNPASRGRNRPWPHRRGRAGYRPRSARCRAAS